MQKTEPLSAGPCLATVPLIPSQTLHTGLCGIHCKSCIKTPKSAPDGGAQSPVVAATVEVEFHPVQILAAERTVLAWLLMTSIARHRALSGKRLQDLPPGQFAPLLAKAPETKQSELQRQKKEFRGAGEGGRTTLRSQDRRPCSGCLWFHRFRPQSRSPRSYF